MLEALCSSSMGGYSHVRLVYVSCTCCRFENCWPAYWKDANGVLLVYNPDKPEHEKDLERW